MLDRCTKIPAAASQWTKKVLKRSQKFSKTKKFVERSYKKFVDRKLTQVNLT